MPKKDVKLAIGDEIQRKESKWKKLGLDKGKDNASFIKEQKPEYTGTLCRLVVLLMRR